MQDSRPRRTYICVHAQFHTVLHSGSGHCPSSADLLASQAISTVTSTQTIQQTGNFSLPWRLSQPPESNAGQSAVDRLCEGPRHLSLRAAAAGLEWKPGPEALLLVCPAMHLNHELRHHSAVLCNQNVNTPLGMLSAMLTCFSAIQELLGSGTLKDLMARGQLSLTHWPATCVITSTQTNSEVWRPSMA